MRNCNITFRQGGRTVGERRVDLDLSGRNSFDEFISAQVSRSTAFDVFVQHESAERIVGAADRARSLEDVLSDLVGGESIDGRSFSLEISAPHVGAVSAVRVVWPASLFDYTRDALSVTRETFGSVEAVFELGGLVKGDTSFCARAFPPVATVASCSFHVGDKDLADCWRKIDTDPLLRILQPVGDLHSHPFGSRPSPSSVDLANAERMAALYSPFTRTHTDLQQPLEIASRGRRHIRYRLTEGAFVSVAIPGTHAPPKARLEQTGSHCSWASIIAPLEGVLAPERMYTSVLVQEHTPVGDHDRGLRRLDDVPLEVVSDEEFCRASGLPRDQVVSFAPTRDDLRAELKSKYRPASYAAAGYGYGAYVDYHPLGGTNREERQYPQEGLFLPHAPTRGNVASLLRETAAILVDPVGGGGQLSLLWSGAGMSDLTSAVAEALTTMRRWEGALVRQEGRSGYGTS